MNNNKNNKQMTVDGLARIVNESMVTKSEFQAEMKKLRQNMNAGFASINAVFENFIKTVRLETDEHAYRIKRLEEEVLR